MAAIVASKTATGTTSGATVEGCDFAVTGTFAGTWAFQALINDTWETMQTGTAPAAWVGPGTIWNGDAKRPVFTLAEEPSSDA